MTERDDGRPGFEALPPAVRAQLRSARGPLVAEVLLGTERGDVPPAPTTILVGSRSAPPMQRAAARLLGQLEAGTAHTLEGLDHLGPLVAPQTVARAIVSAP